MLAPVGKGESDLICGANEGRRGRERRMQISGSFACEKKKKMRGMRRERNSIIRDTDRERERERETDTHNS